MKLWNDLTLLNKLDDKYRTLGKTGAEAVAKIWQDISRGEADNIRKEFSIPEELGLIHAISTWGKHLAIENKLYIKRED
jgi:hypothetical protein